MTWARFVRLQIWGQAVIGVAVFHLWLRGDYLTCELSLICNAVVSRLRLADAHGDAAAFWRCCPF